MAGTFRVPRKDHAIRPDLHPEFHLLDIPKVNIDTPERKALVAIIHDTDDILTAWPSPSMPPAVSVRNALLNIKRNAEAALQEGAR